MPAAHQGPRKDIDFRRVVNALPGLAWTTRADGSCGFVNHAWRAFTGQSLGDARGDGWQAAIHPDDLASFMESWASNRRAGIAAEIDARLQRADGEYRWFVFRSNCFSEDGAGPKNWCWLGLNADEIPIGEPGKTPDGRMRRFLDNLPIQVGFLNADFALEFSNRQGHQDYEMGLEELQDYRTSGAIHPDDHPEVTAQVARLLATGQLYDAAHRMSQKGIYRWMRALAVPCRDAEGNIVRYVSCQIDVDDLKRADALLAAEVALLEQVARGEPLRRILDAICQAVEELNSGCTCSILIVAPGRSRFQIGAASGLPDGYDDAIDGVTIDDARAPYSLAVIEKRRIIVADLAHDTRWQGSAWLRKVTAFGYASCCALPIISASGEPSGVVAVYRRRPGNPTPQEQEVAGRFAKIAGIAIDRDKADASLLASERELREAYAQLTEGQRLSRTGSFTSDAQLDLHRWSAEYYRIFEIDPAIPPSVNTVRDRIHPEDLALFDAEMHQGMMGGDADFTFRVVTPVAGLKYLRGVARLIQHVAGRPVFMGTIQDITESKVAEAALTKSEANLRQALSYLTEAQRLSKTGSFSWDVLSDEHTWSGEISRTFGFDPGVTITMRMILDAVYPDDKAGMESEIAAAANSSAFDFIFRILTAGGEIRHAHVVGHRIEHIIDRPVFLGALQDVTASKVAEEALNRARSELAHVGRVATLNAMTASIAHEVSQPLSGILTNANTCVRMLAADPPNLAGAAETARRTIRDANRASEVLNRLRAMFSKKAPTVEMVDLNDAAREVFALSAGELQKSRAVLHTDFGDNLPRISGDRVQLQQVILNLVLNAADAMISVEDRPRTLLVRTELSDTSDVKLLVQDSGEGVSALVMDKLFDAFYTTKAHGMGVGLSISRSIIENHEGRLWATANDGPGATFAFSIPFAHKEALQRGV